MPPFLAEVSKIEIEPSAGKAQRNGLSTKQRCLAFPANVPSSRLLEAETSASNMMPEIKLASKDHS